MTFISINKIIRLLLQFPFVIIKLFPIKLSYIVTEITYITLNAYSKKYLFVFYKTTEWIPRIFYMLLNL